MRVWTWGIVVLLGLVAGCGRPIGPAPAAGGEDPGNRQAGVYAAVLRHYLTSRDNGGGGKHTWSAVYVPDQAVKGAADPQRPITNTKGTSIGGDVQREITKRLKGIAPVRFVHSLDEVVGGKGCEMKQKDTVLITLAPVPASGDKLKIGINGWQGCMAGTWQTYVVVADGGGGWKVTGTTGANSIS